MKDDIRITNVVINYKKKIDIEYILRLRDVLDKIRHLDIPLDIALDSEEIDNENFYNVMSILSQIPNANITVISCINNVNETNLEILKSVVRQVVHKTSKVYKEMNESLFYLASLHKLTIQLEVNEEIVDLVEDFDDFYNKMMIRHFYKIDYYSEYKDQEAFIEKIKNLRVDGVLYKKQNPMMSITLLEDGTIRYHNKDDIVRNRVLIDLNSDSPEISADVMKKNILQFRRLSDKCLKCNAYNICHGGNEILFENTDNEDLFCRTQQLIRWRLR